MNKKYLIAGATGYLGRHLVEAGKAAGHQVRAVARSPQNVPDCADEVIVAEATEFVRAAPHVSQKKKNTK